MRSAECQTAPYTDLNAGSERESQRDSAIKPRVASSELPWETSGVLRLNLEEVAPTPRMINPIRRVCDDSTESLQPLRLTPAALRAKLESLRITFEQWHTELNPQRQAAVLREVFGGAS